MEQLSLFENKKEKNKKLDINKLLGIKESFELPEALMDILRDDKKRIKLFNKILDFDVDLSKDFMRDYFQEEHSNRSELKQDYTPDGICELLGQITHKFDKILDICSGTGSLILCNYNKEYVYYCEEISNRAIPVLLFNLSIRGLNAIVKQIDVLKNEVYHIYEVKNVGRYSMITEKEDAEDVKFEVIVSNPPYSISWEQQYDERFLDYPLAPKTKADYAFVLDGLYNLSENGKAFFILPHGVLFRGGVEKDIREKLINNNLIETIIGLPDKLFLNTQIPVCIMVLNKAKKDKNILFINAQKEFSSNRKQNILADKNIKKIKEAYNERKDIKDFSKIVSFEELKNNDFNLNIPRYVSLYEKEPIPDLKDTIKDIIDIDEDIKQKNRELKSMLEELQGTTEEEGKYYQENIRILLDILE